MMKHFVPPKILAYPQKSQWKVRESQWKVKYYQTKNVLEYLITAVKRFDKLIEMKEATEEARTAAEDATISLMRSDMVSETVDKHIERNQKLESEAQKVREFEKQAYESGNKVIKGTLKTLQKLEKELKANGPFRFRKNKSQTTNKVCEQIDGENSKFKTWVFQYGIASFCLTRICEVEDEMLQKREAEMKGKEEENQLVQYAHHSSSDESSETHEEVQKDDRTEAPESTPISPLTLKNHQDRSASLFHWLYQWFPNRTC